MIFLLFTNPLGRLLVLLHQKVFLQLVQEIRVRICRVLGILRQLLVLPPIVLLHNRNRHHRFPPQIPQLLQFLYMLINPPIDHLLFRQLATVKPAAAAALVVVLSTHMPQLRLREGFVRLLESREHPRLGAAGLVRVRRRVVVIAHEIFDVVAETVVVASAWVQLGVVGLLSPGAEELLLLSVADADVGRASHIVTFPGHFQQLVATRKTVMGHKVIYHRWTHLIISYPEVNVMIRLEVAVWQVNFHFDWRTRRQYRVQPLDLPDCGRAL